jgi:hypothetical protein
MISPNIHASVGFEPTISVLERAKTVHPLDRAATAIGDCNMTLNSDLDIWFDFGLDHAIPEGYIQVYRDLYLHVGGGLQYLHRCPASRKRQHKGNPGPQGITGPPCSWGI